MTRNISPAVMAALDGRGVHTCEECGHRSATEVTEQETYDPVLKRDSFAYLCTDYRKCTVLITKCMDCGTYMGKKPGYGVTGVSHSICPECFNKRYGNTAL